MWILRTKKTGDFTGKHDSFKQAICGFKQEELLWNEHNLPEIHEFSHQNINLLQKLRSNLRARGGVNQQGIEPPNIGFLRVMGCDHRTWNLTIKHWEIQQN